MSRLIRLPIPRWGVPGDRPQYPFSQLAVGDAFFVPMERAGAPNLAEAIRKRRVKSPGEAFRIDKADRGHTVTRVE